jgi:hypothetical protein
LNHEVHDEREEHEGLDHSDQDGFVTFEFFVVFVVSLLTFVVKTI